LKLTGSILSRDETVNKIRSFSNREKIRKSKKEKEERE